MSEIVDEFHRIYYPIHRFLWRGAVIVKCAQDLMIYQEIIRETEPEAIVECGVNAGGSTLFLSDMIGKGGIVVACDITLAHCHESVRARENVHLIEGSSTSPETVAEIRKLVDGRKTMVILDSDHSEEHVFQECKLYGPIVSPSCYLIVEDTNINGHPVYAEHGPGPAEAVERYLRETLMFEVDRSREKLLLTFNSGGYLKRR